MIIDEMVYDAGTQEGTFNANLVQGVFSFVSGKIAKTSPDGMTVSTPVATIGIRGTKVAGRAAQEGSDNTVSLLSEILPDGSQIVGQLAVSNQAGGPPVVLSVPGATIQMNSAFAPPPQPIVFSPEQIQQNFGSTLTTLSTVAAAKAQNDAAENAQGTTDTAVYWYVEDGASAATVLDSELSLIALVDNQTLVTADFTTA
jgi:trimeric autotransporter adhesin